MTGTAAPTSAPLSLLLRPASLLPAIAPRIFPNMANTPFQEPQRVRRRAVPSCSAQLGQELVGRRTKPVRDVGETIGRGLDFVRQLDRFSGGPGDFADPLGDL